MRRTEPWKREESKILLRDALFLILILWISVFIAESYFVREATSPVDRIFLYLVVFIPLGTLNFLVLYYYRNKRIRRTGNLRSSLRYRLMIAFMVVSIFPSIPIFLVSSDRVETVIGVLFSLDFKGGLLASEELLKQHEREDAHSLAEYAAGRQAFLPGRANWPGNLRTVFDPDRENVFLIENSVILERFGSASVNPLRWNSVEQIQKEGLPIFLGVSSGRRYAAVTLPTAQPGRYYLVTRHLYAGSPAAEIRFQEILDTVASGEEEWEEKIPYNLRLGLAIAYALMITIALGVAIVLARQISHPIVSLAAATRSVTQGKLDTRLDVKAEGELGILIDSFNQMTEELQTLRGRLLHSQRVAAWQEVARRLAHEIKNPLTPIQLSAERMLRRLDRPDRGNLEEIVRSGGSTILEQVNVLKHLVEEFSNFARMPAPRLEANSLMEILQESTQAYTNLADIDFELRISPDLPELALDRNLVIGMVNNLIQNAIDAIRGTEPEPEDEPERPLIRVSAAPHLQAGKRYVQLTVEDSGPGIEEDRREQIFEPYYTTKGENGNGLGLALVERAVLDHNARIYVTGSSLGGAAFRVFFPVPLENEGERDIMVFPV
ncbi:MAG: HAMP domain-containing protein [Leptospiraceae bacterium]|nr:HAMP domain-containing protein [Leptospiraceae bacterium]